MITKSEGHIRFYRKNGIVYEVILNENMEEETLPLFFYERIFPDWEDLKKPAIDYLNKYMLLYPDKYKKLVKDELVQTGQLNLF